MEKLDIGKMLKQIRKQSRIPVKEISRNLQEMGYEKVSPQTIYGYENGVSMPNADVFLSICQICGCTNPLTINDKEDRETSAVMTAYKNLRPSQKEMVLNMLSIDRSILGEGELSESRDTA